MVNTSHIAHMLEQHFKIDSYEIDPHTGKVNTPGFVMLNSQLSELPVQFGHVGGAFWCDSNQLTSLKGAPDHVGGDLLCNNNKLIRLDTQISHVGGTFSCRNNQLESLNGAPTWVGEDFYADRNQITSLEGAPDHVGGRFNCIYNPVTSLSGAPEHVGSTFAITYDINLPLLRFTQYAQVYLHRAPDDLVGLVHKYAGKGKHHMLNFALELKQAGFGGNARW